MIEKLRILILNIIRVINVFLMLISPMALLMLIVALIMGIDHHGRFQRQLAALDEVPRTTTATIASCYPEERYCYANFTDTTGLERYGKLEWRYYATDVIAELETLERGDTILVRYPDDEDEEILILAEHYNAFAIYRRYISDMAWIALVSWFILFLHPEVMLYALVDDMGAYFDRKWKRMTSFE
jgi:hypothetical protein